MQGNMKLRLNGGTSTYTDPAVARNNGKRSKMSGN